MFVAGRLKNVPQFGLAGEPAKGTRRAGLQPSLQEQPGVGRPCPGGRASFLQWRRQGGSPASSSFGAGGGGQCSTGQAPALQGVHPPIYRVRAAWPCALISSKMDFPSNGEVIGPVSQGCYKHGMCSASQGH